MTEAAALRELKRGSEKALEWFIDTYTPYVTAIIRNIIGERMDMADVEEVASDVFFALWENAHKVTSPKSYLGAIARNRAKNKFRELGLELPLEEPILLVEGDDPQAQIEKKEQRLAVKRAILSMPHPEREIFLRHYYYFQKTEDISREMDIPLSTVKTKLRRGRIRLGTQLKAYIT